MPRSSRRCEPVVEKYKNIGVRIEDSYLLTPTGLERLSASVPRTVEEIEGWMKRGIDVDEALAESPTHHLRRRYRPARSSGSRSPSGGGRIIGPKTRPLTDRRFEPGPARLLRGEYLVRNVAACLFCHSELDAIGRRTAHQWPAPPERVRSFAQEGIPFLNSPNITPDPATGAGNWTRRYVGAGDPRRHRARRPHPVPDDAVHELSQHVGRRPRVGRHYSARCRRSASSSRRRTCHSR